MEFSISGVRPSEATVALDYRENQMMKDICIHDDQVAHVTYEMSFWTLIGNLRGSREVDSGSGEGDRNNISSFQPVLI